VWRVRKFAAASAGTLTVAAVPASGAATIGPSTVSAHFQKRLGGLTDPVGVTSARDGVSRLFVTEQRGDIRLVAGSTKLQSAFYLDIRSEVATGGNEQGMLSVVFDPHFTSHPYLWAAYTRSSDGALVVSRFHASSATATAVSAAVRKAAPHRRRALVRLAQLLRAVEQPVRQVEQRQRASRLRLGAAQRVALFSR